MTTVVCQKCDWNLRIYLETEYFFSPLFKCPNLGKFAVCFILLIINVIAIVLVAKADLPLNLSFFALYIAGLILSLLIYWLVLTIRDLLYKKIVRIK